MKTQALQYYYKITHFLEDSIRNTPMWRHEEPLRRSEFLQKIPDKSPFLDKYQTQGLGSDYDFRLRESRVTRIASYIVPDNMKSKYDSMALSACFLAKQDPEADTRLYNAYYLAMIGIGPDIPTLDAFHTVTLTRKHHHSQEYYVILTQEYSDAKKIDAPFIRLSEYSTDWMIQQIERGRKYTELEPLLQIAVVEPVEKLLHRLFTKLFRKGAFYYITFPDLVHIHRQVDGTILDVRLPYFAGPLQFQDDRRLEFHEQACAELLVYYTFSISAYREYLTTQGSRMEEDRRSKITDVKIRYFFFTKEMQALRYLIQKDRDTFIKFLSNSTDLRFLIDSARVPICNRTLDPEWACICIEDGLKLFV